MTEVKIKFANKKAADHFLVWLCESGEQEYWQWMECRESDEKGNITALIFEYHNPNNGKFGPTVDTVLGRLDTPEEMEDLED